MLMWSILPVLALCEDGSVRITIGEGDEYYRNYLSGETYISDSLAVGRVEVCYDGRWRSICRDTWSREDAAVACYQLGFSRAGDEISGELCFMLRNLC